MTRGEGPGNKAIIIVSETGSSSTVITYKQDIAIRGLAREICIQAQPCKEYQGTAEVNALAVDCVCVYQAGTSHLVNRYLS